MLVLRTAATQGGGGGSGPNVPFASVDASGYSVTWGATPTTGGTFQVTRPGYSTAGALGTVTDTLTIMNRLRIPYPTTNAYNQIYLHPTAFQTTVSEPIHASDICIGATNSSTMPYYTPVANWGMYDRRVVGNSIPWEVIAFHHGMRSNEQIACVRAQATDGTNTTPWQVVSTSTVSTNSGDKHAVTVYAGSLDISGLNDVSTITLNAEVMPWIGDATAVLASANITTSPQTALIRRQFSPRKYTKDVARSGIVTRCYVDASIGVDASGVWAGANSGSEAAADLAARANPFLTIGGALNRYATGATNIAATGSRIDGCEIRVSAGTFDLGLTAYATTRTQNLAGVIITRDPLVARSAAIVQLSSGNMRPRFGGAGIDTAGLATGMVVFRDITLNRAASISFQGESYVAGSTYNLDVIIDGVDSDLGNFAASWLGSTCNTGVWGWTFTNGAVNSCPALGGNQVNYSNRGISGTLNRSGALDDWLVLGCDITAGPPLNPFNGRTDSGAIVAFNSFLSPIAGALCNYGTSVTVTGAVFAQNLIENTSNAGAPGYTTMAISADSGLANTNHIIVIHNTATGEQDYGRWNMAYDSGVTQPQRTHKMFVLKGNIGSNFAQKNDVFAGLGGTSNPQNYIGGWCHAMGVSCQGNWSYYLDGGNGNYQQEYPGAGSVLGTTQFTRNDPLFVNYQGVYNIATVITAGAGGGDYNLQAGSGAKAIVSTGILRFDIAGNARNATGDSAGAYFKA